MAAAQLAFLAPTRVLCRVRHAGGRDLPYTEMGLGAAVRLRHLWASGLSAGLPACRAQREDLSLLGGDRRRTMR